MVVAWRALLALAGTAALVLTATAANAQKPQFPLPSGYLVDAAGVIPASDEQRIEASLRDYNDRTGGEVAVALVESIGDTSIQNYANDLFDKWGVGSEKKDNGVLMVISFDEDRREMWIETGYGAEEFVTDIEASQIYQNVRQNLQSGDYVAAVDQGQRAIRRVLGDELADAAVPAPPPVRQERRSSGGGMGLLFFLLPFILVMMSSGMGSRRRRRRGMGFGVPIIYGGGFGGGSGGGGFGGGSGGFGGGGGGGFGGFGGGDSGGGGAGGDW